MVHIMALHCTNLLSFKGKNGAHHGTTGARNYYHFKANMVHIMALQVHEFTIILRQIWCTSWHCSARNYYHFKANMVHIMALQCTNLLSFKGKYGEHHGTALHEFTIILRQIWCTSWHCSARIYYHLKANMMHIMALQVHEFTIILRQIWCTSWYYRCTNFLSFKGKYSAHHGTTGARIYYHFKANMVHIMALHCTKLLSF